MPAKLLLFLLIVGAGAYSLDSRMNRSFDSPMNQDRTPTRAPVAAV